MVTVKLTWAADADRTLPLPGYETLGAAGADLSANIKAGPIMLEPGERALVPTGLHMEIPPGYEVQIRPRSGLAHKYGIALVNSPGTIDSDYRGPVGVLLLNTGATAFEVSHGMRIAQMVVAPVVQARFNVVDALDETSRGTSGFGSTGET